ncbi:glycosyltransferase [Acaryochloris sp. IP29b_bin.148]|uniref:glycosyltransferase n=1 Tax=Acaryochloris sp. IP29b_bin.148 TaxID=2969218 RepID=UPI0026078BEA|nr:glycosyltransferase [Acaryochloris sp. IP29b_bin.148]
MKIAFLVGEFPAISETFILSQITALIDCGHQVSIYAQRPSKDVKMHKDFDKYQLQDCTFYYPTLSKNIVKRYIYAFSQSASFFWQRPLLILKALNIFKYGREAASLRILYRAIPFLHRNHHYDVIHCHHGHVGIIGAALREMGAVKGTLVTTFHGYDVNVIPMLRGREIYTHLFQMSDRFTANSKFTISKLIELGCPVGKIDCLPVGLDISLYNFQHRVLPLAEQPIRVMTVARLVEKKGIEYSIRAIAKVISEVPNIKYYIVGEGPLLGQLEDLIVELNIQNYVYLLGRKTKEEVQELYAQSHLFVLSSVTAKNFDREGQGLVLIEAQAMGLPVVATLHNGFPDSVVDGKSAFLVPERDVDALAERILFLLKHSERWPAMGQQGRDYVAEKFDIRNLNQRLVDIYQSCLT